MNLLGCNVLRNGEIPGSDYKVIDIKLEQELAPLYAIEIIEESPLEKIRHVSWDHIMIGEIFIFQINKNIVKMLEKTKKSGKILIGTLIEISNDDK